MSETAWLVELANTGLGPSRWLSVYGQGLGGPLDQQRGRFVWSDDPMWALRFAREKDARFFVAAMQALQADLPVRCAIIGFRDGDAGLFVAEHAWIDGPAGDAAE